MIGGIVLALPRAPLFEKVELFDVLELQEQGVLARVLGDGSLLLTGPRFTRAVWMTQGCPSRLALATHGGLLAM